MSKSNRFRAGLFFGITITVFNIGWDLATEKDFTGGHLTKVIFSGLIGGALAGLLFSWLIGMFAKSEFISRTTKIETAPDEDVKFETAANRFKGIEAVGGRLYLTNKRVIFKSHKLNIQNHLLSIELGEIEGVDSHTTLDLIDNGLLITTSQGATEKFVVEQIEDWVNLLPVKKSSQSVSTT
jgi:hypothetical protein